MQAKQYPVVLLISSLFVVLNSQSSMAFRVEQGPTIQDYVALSTFTDGFGMTLLEAADPLFTFNTSKDIPFVSPIKLGGTPGLLANLEYYTTQLNWNFRSGRDLNGSFRVSRQSACGTDTLICGGGRLGAGTNGVGSVLELNYIPSRSKKRPEPNPKTDNLYWIQRVTTNYPPGQPGVSLSYIDNRNDKGVNAIYPYYGFGSRIQADGYFGDRPFRPRFLDRIDNLESLDYYWTAELYLVEANKINPQIVTIYNGVRWGWRYRYYPYNCQSKSNNDIQCPPSSPPPNSNFCQIRYYLGAYSTCSFPINFKPSPEPPPPLPCYGSSGGGGCYAANSSDYIDYTDSNRYSKSPASIPESTSFLGLLALAAWGVVKAMKICKDKQS